MSELNIGKVIVDATKTSQVVVNYADTSKPDTSTITSNRSQMTATVESITTAFEASKTLYYDKNGGLSTSNEGYGVAGFTDADGQISVSTLTPTLAIDSPLESDKFELDETITVEWTANNITLINIVIESATGIKTVENIDATLGTYDVDLTADSGSFEVNQEMTITVENVVGAVADSVDISSIATLTIDRPTLTESVEGNVTGTSNGQFVDVFWSVADLEEWHIFAENVAVDENGDYTAVGVVPAQGYKDFKVEDTTDRDGFARVDDVFVASGRFVVDDFEQYTIGENPVGDGDWTIYAGTPNKSEVISDNSEQVWEFKHTVDKLDHNITIPEANYNGKTLKIRAKGLVFNRTWITPGLLDGGNSRWIGTGTRIYNTDYTEFSWNITYDGNVNKLKLGLTAEYYSLYIADVIIE